MRLSPRFILYSLVAVAVSWAFGEPMAGGPTLAKKNMAEPMGGMFGEFWGKEPKVKEPESAAPMPEAPPPTMVDEKTELAAAQAAEEERAAQRRRGGEAGTVLTSRMGNVGDDEETKKTTRRKSLLGS